MSVNTDERVVTTTGHRDSRRSASGPASRWVSLLAFDKVGAVYVWLAIIVVFSVWVPDTFPNLTTAKQILNANAITGLAALSVTIPLAARVFDLSFALNMTLCGVAVAHFVVDGVPLIAAILLGVLIGLVVGLINATVVVGMKIDSFIATLATGSLIQALITMVTNDTPISDAKLAGGFSKIGQTTVGGITLPVFYFAVVAIGIWYLLEHTATGRRLYAVGFNPDAARLAGVKVARLQFLALVTSGVLAGAAGIVLASILGGGSPTAGTPYLLPGFAAVFLGATQLKNGRFNAGGTLIAVLLLGTGTTGLGLANAPQWSGSLFVGIVLIAALMVTGLQRRTTLAARSPAPDDPSSNGPSGTTPVAQAASSPATDHGDGTA
jgi:ribose transport system permease protein